MSESISTGVVAAIRAVARERAPARIEPEHSFVTDLGFDSMAIVVLGLALEDRFDRPVMLDEWIGRCEDPTELTVASLCSYLEESLAHGAAPVQR
jgi:acyl carrier protein